jgi:glycosyltransferase involved in cell wall biosynthesis
MRILNLGLGGVTREYRNWPERIHALALARRGHQVVAYGYRDPANPLLAAREERIEGVLVRRLPRRHWPTPELWRALDRDGPFDVAHFSHPRNVLAYGAARWCRARGVPIVYTWLGPFHDRYLIDDREQPYDERPKYERLIFTRRDLMRRLIGDWRLGIGGTQRAVSHPKLLTKAILDRYRNYWLHAPLAWADALMPPSRHEALVLRAMGLHQPCTVVPLWVEAEARDAPTERQSPKTNIQSPTILYVGQLTRRKCYDLLVEAMPRIVGRFAGARFLFVTHNPAQRAHLLELAAERGVAGHVEFLGRLGDDELQALYRSVDVYAFPSRYEGFGLPVLEAMAAGCPVVTTDIPVIDELVRHDENGWLVRYNDASALAEGICAVLENPALRARLVAGGLRTIREQFSEGRLVAQIEDVFTQVLS